MDRRSFLSQAGAALVAGTLAPEQLLAESKRSKRPIDGGWLPGQYTDDKPDFATYNRALYGTGRRKLALLWKYLERATRAPLVPHKQGVGDCVSQGYGLGADILTCVQLYQLRRLERWMGKAATEIIHAGARVQIAGGRLPHRDACTGKWAAQWCREGGILLRKRYGDFDFTTYDPQKARRWAHKCNNCTEWGGGVPDVLLPLCRQHPIRTAARVTSWEHACDALANGYPIIVCSDQGFKDERDADGFAEPSSEKWYHAMLLAGLDTLSRRHGGLIINSWGRNWIKGPKRWRQPDGSFWVEPDTLDYMLSIGDSYAISNYRGYPRRSRLDYRL